MDEISPNLLGEINLKWTVVRGHCFCEEYIFFGFYTAISCIPLLIMDEYKKNMVSGKKGLSNWGGY